MDVYPMRILPGEEVTSFLHQYITENNLKAAFVVTCVGSVRSIILRFATDTSGNHAISKISQNLEICSLEGTISQDGCHLHGTFGDEKGCTISGHVMGDMVVQTTVEIVIGNAIKYEFTRDLDTNTGFRELVVKNKESRD